jgi:hypothetical protein
VDIGVIEEQLATRKGFAALVERPAGLRNTGIGVGFVGLVFGALLLLVGRAADSLRVIALCLGVGLVVVIVGLVHERLRLPRAHQQYLAHGWVSVQVDTGLVRDSSGEGNSVVRRDLGLDSETHHGCTPVVLVGGREASPEDVGAAGAAARNDVRRMTDEQARLFSPRVSEGLYRDADAATLFPVPPGMFLTVRTGSSPFIVVIPAAGGWRRTRQRYYGMKVPRRPGPPGQTRESRSRTAGGLSRRR